MEMKINQGNVRFIEGSFDLDKAMYAICELVIDAFATTTFRQKRRMILDASNVLLELWNTIDESYETNIQVESLACNITYSKQNLLSDVIG